MSAADNSPSNNATPRVTRIRDTAAQDVAHDQPPPRRWRLLIFAIALLIIGVVAWPSINRWNNADLSVPLERLRLAEVSKTTFEREVAVRGTVIAAVSPTLYAPAQGIASLHVQAGDLVDVGDRLVTIASPELENQLALETATLESMNTALERQRIDMRKQQLLNRQTADLARVAIVAAQRELRRAEAAWEAKVISRQDNDKARDDLDTATLEYQHAQDNARLETESLSFELRAAGLARDRQQLTVDELNRRLAELAIVSPVKGVVGTLAIEERQLVTINTPLITVVDLGAYEIEMTIPESYADDIVIGLPAFIEVGADKHPGTVTSVSPEVLDGQVRGRIRFASASPVGLRQNQRVSVRVQMESRAGALVVRRGPFYDDGGGRIAYVVADGVARKRTIRSGAVSIDQVEILEGLTAGERIVISSLEQFRGADTVLLSQ